ncbi:MAG: hypothetical protein P4L50_02065 [Anaerolineaceae bacterium]|nr:hypothetical protein [Anaerolineaceae bacterium]
MTEAENNLAKPGRKHHGRHDSVDLLVYIIPCLQVIQVKIIGVTNGSDLLLMAVFVYLLFRKRLQISTPTGRRFLILGSLWLVAQCVTDIIRRSAFADYARGWGNIGITLGNFAVLWTLLYGRPRRLVLYGWGLVTGSLLTFYFAPNDFATGDPWKFGISYPATLAVVLLASRKKCRGRWPAFMVAMIGIVNMYLGSRNAGGVCLGAALYLLVTRYLQRKGAATLKLNAVAVVIIGASIILGGVAIVSGYRYAASTGKLGLEARMKYETQSSGQYGILLDSRKELMASLPAIYDSPILGHGSWARDPVYLIAARRALAEMGYEDAWDMSSDEFEEGYIPTHSYIFGAWVDAGIVGALFWGWVFVVTARGLMRVYAPTVVLLPVAAYFAFTLFWDILFSPYGTLGRIVAPYYFVMLITCFSMAPKNPVISATGKVKAWINDVFTP